MTNRPTAAGRAPAAVAAAAVGLLMLAACGGLEETVRSQAEEAARSAVAEATAAAGSGVTDETRERARQALDSSLDELPGTCADLLRLPASTREQNADDVLRTFWLSELTTADPPAETVDAFSDAVLARCRESKETSTADVLREVWATGSYAP